MVGFDPLLSYPVHQRQRHPPPPGPQVPHHLPARRRPPRTARSPPARAQPRHGGCPAGSPAVNVTALGAPCLRWADVLPLLERPPPEGWAPLRGQRHYLCRSPDGAGRPWCFYRSARGRGAGGHCGCGPGERRARGAGRGARGGARFPAQGVGAWALRPQGVLCVGRVSVVGVTVSVPGAALGAPRCGPVSGHCASTGRMFVCLRDQLALRAVRYLRDQGKTKEERKFLITCFGNGNIKSVMTTNNLPSCP